MSSCIYPGCGRPVGSKSDDHHPWSCGKSTCDVYARGVAEERALIVKSLRDECANDKPSDHSKLSGVIVDGLMVFAKGVLLGFADRIAAGKHREK